MTRRDAVSDHDAREHTNTAPYPRKLWIAILVAAVAVAVRCLPSVGKTPDSDLFLSLAANLIQNFCYSASTVTAHLCLPTWGQQPPGYPIFIAVTQWLPFWNERIVAVSQTMVFAVAAIYFARWLFAWHRNTYLFHASVVIAMFSPITIGWSRAIMTELLTSASTMWVLTELLRSNLQKQVRIWPLGLSLAAAMLMRWDQICLLPVAAVVLGLVLGWRNSLGPLIATTAISAIPYLTLMVRAALLTLPLLPSAFVGTNSVGVVAFYRVAALDERATEGFAWQIIGEDYQELKADGFDEFTSRIDRGVLNRLFASLHQLPDGSEIPKPVDDDFARIAGDLSQHWVATQMVVPLIRAGRLWKRWIGHNIAFSSLGGDGTVHVILAIYALSVIGGVLAGAIVGPFRSLYLFAVILAIVRTGFLVSIPVSALENRYLDELFPAFDMMALCALWLLIGQHTVSKDRSLEGRGAEAGDDRRLPA